MATELHPVTGLDPGLKNTDCRGRGWTRNRVWMGAGLTQWARLLFFSCSTGVMSAEWWDNVPVEATRAGTGEDVAPP